MPSRSRSIAAVVVSAAVATMFVACTDNTGPNEMVGRVVVAPPPALVALDDTVRLHASVYDRHSNVMAGIDVHWRLAAGTPPAMAAALSLDSAGLVTGRSVGVVTVVATAGLASDSVAVTVGDAPTSIQLVASNTMLASGGNTLYRAVVLGRRGDTLRTAPVSWSTTDATAVTASAEGVVTAVSKGSAWVTASSGALRDSVQVMVDYRKKSGPQPFVSVTLFTTPLYYDTGCALTATGAAYCWGSNNNEGLLGNGTREGSATPVAVSGGLTFKELHAGNGGACGLTIADGALYCWGRNHNAMFGTSSRLPSGSLVPIATGSGLHFSTMSLSIDGSACGVSAVDAVLYCWGTDTYLTTGKDTSVAVYIDSIVAPVTGSLKAAQVHVYDYHGCALGVDRATWCWGWGETFGVAGIHKGPTQIAPPDAFASVVTGFYSTCGLKADGQAFCWGYPSVAPGSDPSVPVMTPTAVGGSLRFKKVSVGYYEFACGLTTTGDVYCWGPGGLVGRVGTAPASAPVQVLAGRKFVDVDESCAVDVAGDIYCW